MLKTENQCKTPQVVVRTTDDTNIFIKAQISKTQHDYY